MERTGGGKAEGIEGRHGDTREEVEEREADTGSGSGTGKGLERASSTTFLMSGT